MIFAPSHKVFVGAKNNNDLSANIGILLSILCFILLLNVVYNHIKLLQDRDIFISDFIQALNVVLERISQ